MDNKFGRKYQRIKENLCKIDTRRVRGGENTSQRPVGNNMALVNRNEVVKEVWKKHLASLMNMDVEG